jgi:glycosyltransferase involved in cell wall biosynthesis
MSTPPRVSVVVPVRNAVADAPRLLDALDALRWPEDRLERIVVDNGSTDGTAEALTRPGVTVLHESRPGSYAARNRGIAAATGEWIAFTDADCAPRPDWLTRLLADPVPEGTGAIAGEVFAAELGTPVQRFIERRGFMKHELTLPHKALPCFSTASVAVRRELLARLGGFREESRYFGDMELSWRMQLEAGASILFRPDAIVLHRHRRTLMALWAQAVQHGRGTAFMKRAYPEVYLIHPGEQVRRLFGIAAASGQAVTGGEPDRWRVPGYLAVWYAGLLWGYLLGPAWTQGRP